MWVSIGLFLSGAIFSLIAIGLLLKKRIVTAGINGLTGISLLSLSAVTLLIFLNVHTYSRLTGEMELARVKVGPMDANGIPITLQQADWQQQYYIHATEWQLDARFLKWKPWASLLGKDPVVRLERLTGRYGRDIGVAPAVHELIDRDNALSRMGAALSDWFGIVDAYYGSSVYMPTADGAVYIVSASISGLVARPENSHAKQAVKNWMSP